MSFSARYKANVALSWQVLANPCDIRQLTMPFVFGLIIAVSLTIFVVSRRKRGSAVAVETIVHEEYSIPVTREMLEAERQDNSEVIILLEAAIRASGLFRIEKIPELVSKLRAESRPFARVNTKVAFGGGRPP